jgi:hypothetical protein
MRNYTEEEDDAEYSRMRAKFNKVAQERQKLKKDKSTVDGEENKEEEICDADEDFETAYQIKVVQNGDDVSIVAGRGEVLPIHAELDKIEARIRKVEVEYTPELISDENSVEDETVDEMQGACKEDDVGTEEAGGK